MDKQPKSPQHIDVDFPADIEYVPALRKLISELAIINGFTPKYAYRAEIITDEICSNAVKFGAPKLDSRVQLKCVAHEEMLEMTVKDEGGQHDDLDRLRKVIDDQEADKSDKEFDTRGRGLEIVRMLSNGVDLKVNEAGVTEIHVVKYREDREESF